MQENLGDCASPLTVYGFETLQSIKTYSLQPRDDCAPTLTVYGFETEQGTVRLVFSISAVASPLLPFERRESS